jgi:hypothetical protein
MPISSVAMVATQYPSNSIDARLHTTVAGYQRDDRRRHVAHADGHVQIQSFRLRR